MYDQAEAARRRILTRVRGSGLLGRQYLELANNLMRAPDSPLRTLALKQLADSCDNAIALLEKTRQQRENRRDNRRSPGQSNG